VTINPCCGLAIIFCSFISLLIGRETINIPEIFSGVHGFTGMTVNIKITGQNYRRTLTKHRKAKKGRGWTKPERIEVDCIWINLKNVGPPFSNLRYARLYIIKLSLPQLENHSQLLCGHDFANERLLVCQFDV